MVSQEYVTGDVISLPGVVTNSGGAYNLSTSTFTCPTAGHYYIYFNLYIEMSATYDDCEIELTMDDSRIVEVRHRDKCCDDKHFGRGSCTFGSFQVAQTLDVMYLIHVIDVVFLIFDTSHFD